MRQSGFSRKEIRPDTSRIGAGNIIRLLALLRLCLPSLAENDAGAENSSTRNAGHHPDPNARGRRLPVLLLILSYFRQHFFGSRDPE